MRALERQRNLLALVVRQKNLTIEEACKATGISEATARRDFNELAKRNDIEKRWGAIALNESGEKMAPSDERQTLNPLAKQRIAEAACALIQDQEVILIDGGTTTLCMAPFLANRPVRILTNSLLIAHQIDHLRSKPDGAEVYLTGGYLYPASGLLVGPEAVKSLKQYHARWAFLSVSGLDEKGGSNTNQLVVESEQAMIHQAQSIIVMADASKWAHKEMTRAFQWDQVETIVTNGHPPCSLSCKVTVV